jgi:hypothetical protein
MRFLKLILLLFIFIFPKNIKAENYAHFTGNITLNDVYTTYFYNAFDTNGSGVNKTEHTEKITEVSPLTPIIIVPNGDKLPLIAMALGENSIGNNNYIVPAILLKYQADKIRNDYIEKGVVTTIDLATIYFSGGTALATKVTWVRRAWAMAEVAGAVGNIAVNTGTVDPNSNLGKAINAYNLGMAVIGVKNVAQGGYKFVSNLPQATRTLLQENKGIRNLLLLQYLEYRIVITKLKNSDDWSNLSAEVRQSIAKQEKAFIDITDAKNIPNDKWGVPDNVFINGKTKQDILTIPKGERPLPETYLSSSYMQQHLAKFENGAVRFTTKSSVNKYGTIGSKEAFTMPKSKFDNLMIDTGGNLGLIEQKLGLNKGDLTGNDAVIAFIKREDISNIKMPSGNEKGVIPELWLPGGRTAGGYYRLVK